MPCMQSLPGACAALRPINHRKDRLAGFRAVVCDPKLPSAKGSSRPKAVVRVSLYSASDGALI